MERTFTENTTLTSEDYHELRKYLCDKGFKENRTNRFRLDGMIVTLEKGIFASGKVADYSISMRYLEINQLVREVIDRIKLVSKGKGTD